MKKSYVLKYGIKYCHFEQYGSFRLVDNPENASVYSRLRDAMDRRDRQNKFPDMSYPDNIAVYSVKLQIVEEELVP